METKYHVLTVWGSEYEINQKDWDQKHITKDVFYEFRKGDLVLKGSSIAGFIKE